MDTKTTDEPCRQRWRSATVILTKIVDFSSLNANTTQFKLQPIVIQEYLSYLPPIMFNISRNVVNAVAKKGLQQVLRPKQLAFQSTTRLASSLSSSVSSLEGQHFVSIDQLR